MINFHHQLLIGGLLFGLILIGGIVLSQRVSAVDLFNIAEPTATIVFTGDMMFDRGVKNFIYQNYNGDYSLFLEKIKSTPNP